jgi:ABC-2 type transport system permease protein
MGIVPGPAQVGAYLTMLVCGLVSLYALWFMSVTLVLWTGRIHNISMVMGPIIEIARVPSDVYRGFAKPLMVYVLPVAAIATLPARAMLDILEPLMLVYQVVLATTLLWLSHWFWQFSLRRYTSASS